MSGRLSGLKDALKAERQPPTQKEDTAENAPEPGRISTRAKARVGKRALVGYFSPELSRTLNMMATSAIRRYRPFSARQSIYGSGSRESTLSGSDSLNFQSLRQCPGQGSRVDSVFQARHAAQLRAPPLRI